MLVATDPIQSELERIVNSKEFSSSPRLIRFLRYCVEQTHAGQLDSLKESVIGVSVFDRLPSYDPKADPIVRVHARRLREKLKDFYDSEGCHDIVIQMPKGGYVARFEEAPARAKTSQPSSAAIVTRVFIDAPPKSTLSNARSTAWIVASLCALVTLAWLATRPNLLPPKVQPLVSLPGSVNDPAWAPDGKAIAFTWDGGASRASQVYLLKNGESVPTRLTDAAQPESRPVWSPDGKSIALLRENRDRHFAIVLVNKVTRAERIVRTVLQFSPMLIPPALDWSPDGKWLVSSEQPNEGPDPVHLLLISPQDGRSWVITDPPNGSTGDLEARFSPDSKRILFRRGGQGDLYMLSLNGTTATPPVQLTFDNAGVRGLSVSRDGNTIYFGSQRGHGQYGIWSLRKGEAPTLITPQGMAAVAPAIDPADHSLAFAQPVVDVNLWLYDVRRNSDPRLLVPSTAAEYSPEFSPDGRQVAFISDRSGAAQIWISGLNGGQPRKLTSLREGDLPMAPSWSPDGTKIALFCRSSGLNYAYETDVATGVTRPLRGGEDYALFPQYSADAKSIFFVSNSGHRFRIWREPLAGAGSAAPAVVDEVRFFRISKDRRYLYFLRSDHPQRLVQMNLATKDEKTLWTFADSLTAFDAWDVSSNRLFYVGVDPSSSLAQLEVVDLNTGGRQVLGPLRRLSHEWQTAVAASPDGNSAIVTQVDSDDTRLMLLHSAVGLSHHLLVLSSELPPRPRWSLVAQ